MRINKFIAHCGICSRRNAEKLILNGEIKVNGNILTDLSYQIDENKDIVTYKNKKISLFNKKYYFLLNKPIGYTCTNSSNFNDRLIFDLIDIKTKLFSIGRLDKDSRGLIIITNDGEIYNNVIHPRNEIFKEYVVSLDKKFDKKYINILENGIDIGGYITNPAKIINVNNNIVIIKINEGKNRQIRKMFDKIGYKVVDLNRISIGDFKLKNLSIGKYRELNENEINYLKNL